MFATPECSVSFFSFLTAHCLLLPQLLLQPRAKFRQFVFLDVEGWGDLFAAEGLRHLVNCPLAEFPLPRTIVP